MSTRITKYETKNGKTRRVPANTGKTGSPEPNPGDGKNNLPPKADK
jgi:hypothetical protein